MDPAVQGQAELDAQSFLQHYDQLLQRSPYPEELKESLADRLSQYASGLQTEIGTIGMSRRLSPTSDLPFLAYPKEWAQTYAATSWVLRLEREPGYLTKAHHQRAAKRP